MRIIYDDRKEYPWVVECGDHRVANYRTRYGAELAMERLMLAFAREQKRIDEGGDE